MQFVARSSCPVTITPRGSNVTVRVHTDVLKYKMCTTSTTQTDGDYKGANAHYHVWWKHAAKYMALTRCVKLQTSKKLHPRALRKVSAATYNRTCKCPCRSRTTRHAPTFHEAHTRTNGCVHAYVSLHLEPSPSGCSFTNATLLRKRKQQRSVPTPRVLSSPACCFDLSESNKTLIVAAPTKDSELIRTGQTPRNPSRPPQNTHTHISPCWVEQQEITRLLCKRQSNANNAIDNKACRMTSTNKCKNTRHATRTLYKIPLFPLTTSKNKALFSFFDARAKTDALLIAVCRKTTKNKTGKTATHVKKSHAFPERRQ